MAYDFPNSPTTGQVFNVTGGPTYVWNGTAWVVLTPGNQFNRTVFTATAGQTTFSMNYVVGAIDVYRNGVKLAPADFTATNGTSIVLANGCTVGDTVEVISYPMITYSDAVKRTGDTMTGALAVPSLTVNSVPVLAGPAFRAYLSSNQSISSSTRTRVTLNATSFDTASAVNTSTYRITPQVAGYYFVTASTGFSGTSISAVVTTIRKNNVEITVGAYLGSISGGSTYGVSDLIYMNGATDYLELYSQINGSSPVFAGDSLTTYLAGYLVRAV